MKDDGNIVPLPSMTVQKRTLHGCEMAVVIVQPANAPPVRLRGRTHIRVGPRKAIASAQDERVLTQKRRSLDLPYDLRPITSATVLDLDLELFSKTYLPSAVAEDVLAENERSVEDQLSALRFLTPGSEKFPTVVGLLVAGTDPLRYLPGAYVQFLRIAGGALSDPIQDEREISGPLPEMMRVLEEVLSANNFVSVDFQAGSKEIRRSQYPRVALDQLIRNAVIHRDYEGTHTPVRVYWFSDRIEIHSPGGPFGNVNEGNFGQPYVTDYRNPYIAEAMRNLGYVQRFGAGIAAARKAMLDNGNPPVEFQVSAGSVLAILRLSA